MNNKTIEILIFLLGYLKENSFDDDSLSQFSENLIVSGYSESDVADALGLLLEKLNYVPMKSAELSVQKDTSTRMLSDIERMSIPPDAYGYILKLRSLSLISGAQMERVIDYCMFTASNKIAENEINEIVAEIIFEDHMKETGREN